MSVNRAKRTRKALSNVWFWCVKIEKKKNALPQQKGTNSCSRADP